MSPDIIFGEVTREKIKIDARELSARLGGYCTSCSSVADEYIYEILDAASPRYAARLVDVEYTDDGAVSIAGRKIYSAALIKNLAGAEQAYLLAVTLGIEVDRYLKRMSAISPARHFIADGVASALAEALADASEREICKGYTSRPRFSPGYADIPLSYQSALLAALSDERRLGISLTDSYLMIPTKSISAIIGIEK
ncbi:MAG: hypothetical protein IJW03_04670 [Clostridia bacterium]|nr:hypothetical protein [Clostridia bacterium]